MSSDPGRCEWINLRDALSVFVRNLTGHQGQGHIRPLHYYVASRLVVEGGFDPDCIVPRPPFIVESRGSKRILLHEPTSGRSGERTVLGGLKTKAVDVVVTRDGVGPVIAVSMKGTLGAFRNLTNRMEEAIGDCTNLHISYPALVYGFLQVLRGTREGPGIAPNDVCLAADGKPVDSITRYHNVLARLEGRKDLRNETTKYEAVALALVIADGTEQGTLSTVFPPLGSPLALSGFFAKLYQAYDLRYVYAAPKLESVTSRMVWDETSPALRARAFSEYQPRIGPSAPSAP